MRTPDRRILEPRTHGSLPQEGIELSSAVLSGMPGADTTELGGQTGFSARSRAGNHDIQGVRAKTQG